MTVLVTIAYYGVPDLIERAVRSVLAQTHTDLELLVIGDGQEPPALDVADARLHVHTTARNRGPYFCQAVALAASPHEWYATVGADDWVEPDHLERLLAANASAVIPAYIWNDEHREQAWLSETGITATERLRDIGGFNASERIGQDSLNARLLRDHGGILKTRKATYHRVTRDGSLTTAPETGIGSPARLAVRSRNHNVLRATRRMSVPEVRAYREALVPKRIRDEVAAEAERLAESLYRVAA
jgi:glycosyltransferase involved in cell wall biosynthesis